VRDWADTCVVCQPAKVHHHIKAPLAHSPVLERRFDHVHMDVGGLLLPSQGFTYLLTTVDMTTSWPEAVPLSSATFTEVARTFITMWVAGSASHLTSP